MPAFTERYYAYHLQTCQDALREAQQNHDLPQAQTLHIALRVFEAIWSRTDKILYADSAERMVLDLIEQERSESLARRLHPLSCAVPVWIELETPLVPPGQELLAPAIKGLHFLPFFDPAIMETVKTRVSSAEVSLINELASLSHIWLLDLVTAANEIVCSFALDRAADSWGFPPIRTCPFNRCGGADSREEPCEGCCLWLLYWAVIFPLLLLVKDQCFASSKAVTETVLRRVPRQRSGKTRTVPVKQTYRLIDASSKTVREVRQALFPRGSWLKQHQPEEIAYIEKTIRPYSRTYRSERYTNMRGQTQNITPGARRIPTLKDRRRFTKVVASAYAGNRSEGKE